MKCMWVCVLVMGLVAVVATEGEEEANTLQNINGGTKRTFDDLDLANLKPDAAQTLSTIVNPLFANPADQFLLKIGNLIAALAGFDLGGLDDKLDLGNLAALKPDLAGAAAGAAGAAGAAALGGGLAAISAIKTAVLGLGVKGLEVANFVLAIIALALLTVYLVKSDGDLKGLVGYDDFSSSSSGSGSGSGYYSYDDGHDSYSSYARSARSLWYSPVAQQITDLITDAITKYAE